MAASEWRARRWANWRPPRCRLSTRRPGPTVPIGLDLQAGSIRVVGLSIYGFGDSSNDDSNADIRVDTAASGTLIEGDLIGAPTTGPFDIPPLGDGDDVRVVNSGSGVLRDCLLVESRGKGVELHQGSDGWLIQGNEIRANGFDSYNLDGIDIEAGSGDDTISGNLIVGNWACGIDSFLSFGGNTISGNTISGNGIGVFSIQESPGIRLYGNGSLVESNVIDNNYGAGVLVIPGSLQDTITRNSIDGNGSVTNLAGAEPSGEIGIDILSPTDSASSGTAPYVTLNTSDVTRDGIHGPANFPVFTGVQVQNDQLTISGFARPGALIDLYLADPSSNGFGQGTTYLGSFVEGSPADTDGGTGSYGPIVNGVTVGSDTTNRFSFTIPAPAGLLPGAYVTATATENGLTSEFGPVARVVAASGPLTYQPTGTGPHAITLQVDSSNIEILDNGSVVAQEPISLVTSIQLQGLPGDGDTLEVNDTVSFTENLSISGFASTSILIGGDLSGQITASTSTTIQSVEIDGSVDPGASITAGAFQAAIGQSPPSVLIKGDLAGTVGAVEVQAVSGSGVLGSIEIDGNLLASGKVQAGSIGSITVKKNLSGQVLRRARERSGTSMSMGI